MINYVDSWNDINFEPQCYRLKLGSIGLSPKTSCTPLMQYSTVCYTPVFLFLILAIQSDVLLSLFSFRLELDFVGLLFESNLKKGVSLTFSATVTCIPRFRATLKFWQFNLNFGKSCILTCLSAFDIKKSLCHKAVIKGVFSRPYCFYSNLLCHENDNNMFTNDWAVFFDTMIVSSSNEEWLTKS